MNTDMTVLFSNLLGLFALIAVGYIAVRSKILPSSASAPLTTLLMKITLPATIFTSMVRPLDPGFFRDSLVILVLSFAALLAFAALAPLLCRLLRVSPDRRGMWMMCVTFCNNGFMGFPVVYALLGDDGLALAAMIGIPFNLLVYSLGIKQVSLDIPQSAQAPQLSWRGILFTLINLSVVLGLVFYYFQLPVPTAILTPIQHLSNVTTPLSMIVTGMNLAGSRITDVLRDRDVITASLVRLLLYPILLWAVLSLLPISQMSTSVLLIIMAMPAPAAATILGEQYGGRKELAAQIVFLSSLFCIVTLPLVTLLL